MLVKHKRNIKEINIYPYDNEFMVRCLNTQQNNPNEITRAVSCFIIPTLL